MIHPHATSATFWRPDSTSTEHARQDRALEGLVNDDPAIDDFIEHLNCAINDLVCRK